jgi:hypothetical protein
MKIKVIKDCYYVTEDLTNIGLVDKDVLESSIIHTLVKGDVWESIDDEGNFNGQVFKCIEGKWCEDNLDETNDGWWDYEGNECYFEVID